MSKSDLTLSKKSKVFEVVDIKRKLYRLKSPGMAAYTFVQRSEGGAKLCELEASLL